MFLHNMRNSMVGAVAKRKDVEGHE